MATDPFQNPESYEDAKSSPVEGTNVLGIVGFILSFCVGPIGLIISLVALAKRPRGFAIAGVVIGFITTAILGLLAAFFAAGGARIIMKTVDITQDYGSITNTIDAYKSANNGSLPPDLAAAGVAGLVLEDGWGTAYRYEPSPDGTRWVITSAGADLTFGTADDFTLPSGMDRQALNEAITEGIERTLEQQMGPAGRVKRGQTPAADSKPEEPKPAEGEPASSESGNGSPK